MEQERPQLSQSESAEPTQTERVARKEQETMEGELARAREKETTPEHAPEIPPRERPMTSAVLQDALENFSSNLSKEEQKRFFTGIPNLGFLIEEWKGKKLSELYGRLADTTTSRKETGEAERNFLSRWFLGFKKEYELSVNRAQKNQRDLEEGKGILTRTKGVGMLWANAAWYGRTLYDAVSIAGAGSINPLRFVTAGAMFFGRGMAAAKEARFMSKESLEKTREEDIQKAYEEAWRLHKLAKQKGEVTKEALEKAYQQELPHDLLERLSKKPEGLMTALTEGLARNKLENDILKILNETRDIEKNSFLSPDEKEKAKTALLERHAHVLREADALVGRSGAIDLLAYGSRFFEHVGKGVAVGMAIETMAEGAWRLAAAGGEIAAGHFEFGKGKTETPLQLDSSGSPSKESVAALAAATTRAAEDERMLFADESTLDSALRRAATIGKGEGIEHSFIRQIKLHPEWFGFTGDKNDARVIQEFADARAHHIAMEYGYVKTEGAMIAEETRVREPGGLYVLEPDGKGGVKDIHTVGRSEYLYSEAEEHTKEVLEAEEKERAAVEIKKEPLVTETEIKKHREEVPAEEEKKPMPEPKQAAPRMQKSEETAGMPEIGANQRALEIIGVPRDITERFSSEINTLNESELSALGIAAKDLGFDTASPETMEHYFRYTLDTLHSKNPREVSKWIDEGYRSIMEKDMAGGAFIDGKPLTKEYIDSRAEELRSLLLPGEKTTPLEMPVAEQGAAPKPSMEPPSPKELPPEPIESLPIAGQKKIVERAAETIMRDIENYDKKIRQIDSALQSVQNPSLRQSLENQKWQFRVERQGLEEVVKNPHAYGKINPSKNVVIFEGTYKVTPRPGDVSGIQEFNKPFRLSVPISQSPEISAAPPSSEKPLSAILENIITRSDQTLELKAVTLATQLQNGSIFPEDFAAEYVKRLGGDKHTIIRQLKQALEKTHASIPQERAIAQATIKTFAERFMKAPPKTP